MFIGFNISHDRAIKIHTGSPFLEIMKILCLYICKSGVYRVHWKIPGYLWWRCFHHLVYPLWAALSWLDCLFKYYLFFTKATIKLTVPNTLYCFLGTLYIVYTYFSSFWSQILLLSWHSKDQILKKNSEKSGPGDEPEVVHSQHIFSTRDMLHKM